MPPEILKLINTLTPNETEAAILTGQDPSTAGQESLPRLASILDVPNLVVTLGSKGAYILQGGGSTTVNSFPIRPVDTTAAGDAFNGALAVALARGESLSQAVRYANAAGAITATRLGASLPFPRREELDHFIATSAPGLNPAVPDAVDQPG